MCNKSIVCCQCLLRSQCLFFQCCSSPTAEHRQDDVHWQHKGPGLQQQGSALHSTLLSAYPLTTLPIAQPVTTNAQKMTVLMFLIFKLADSIISFSWSRIITRHLSIPLLFPLMFSVDILLNRSQQLFASCTAKFADGQQCSIPVFDITHQTPLCEEHAKKMVS